MDICNIKKEIIMNRKLFEEKYQNFNIKKRTIAEYFKTVSRFEEYIDKDIGKSSIEDIRNYVAHLTNSAENTYANLIHVARSYYYIDKKTEYIHMTKYFNSVGVLENIIDRITLFETKEKQEDIMKEVILPPFGTDTVDLPKYTRDFMTKLKKYLPRNKCHKILAGNNHKIPKSSILIEKEKYEEADSLKNYLKDRHNRKINELKEHYQKNLVWFEQIITEDAIEYVASNQEILSGVLENDKIYITKIPYEINNFLNEKDEKLKKYYACHCSFVRENIIQETESIPKDWCYCSAGYAKYPFEVILGQELEVKLLNTPLDGDFVCRFEIDLSNVDYK